jgi:hypothetical protein
VAERIPDVSLEKKLCAVEVDAPADSRVLFASTGSWPFTTRLAINLAKAGVEVSAACPRNHLLRCTRAVQRLFPYSAHRPLRALEDAIEKSGPQIIIPCDERAVEHVHELHARVNALGKPGRDIAGLIERSLGAAASYPIVSSRLRLLEVAREEGIRVPETRPIRSMNDCAALESGRFPWVLKADGTWGGQGVKIAANPPEAIEIFFQLNRVFGLAQGIKRIVVNRDLFWSQPWRRSRTAIIAQAYVRGIPANSAAFCWQGKVLAAVGVEVLRSEGATKPATVVRLVNNAEMTLALEIIAKRLGLSGFFGLDFVIEEGSGTAFLIEMNPRCTPLCHLRLGRGRDLIGAFVEQLSGQRLPDAPPLTQKDIIAYFPQSLQEPNEYLESSFLDMPHDEPELIRRLLRPGFGRALLSRLSGARKASAWISATGRDTGKDAVQ